MASTPAKALKSNAMTPAKASTSNDDESREGITVAIRMRPLNNVEGNQGRVWKVLPQYSSVTQTTREGKPLNEKITNRTFFTFDKTFGEDTNNAHVYDGVAKGIVTSVVDGLNGTIFAYGQTSSGKTYTMQGSGNLEQGSEGEGGIVHMAAKDIFMQIAKQSNRMFLVRVSFLEIYNEEVRDLLADSNQTLQIREDPRRGVFVQSVEEIVTDFETLLPILIRGDKSRTFAATGMNERSSRSHTILRITIESREKEVPDDLLGDIENHGPSGDGAVRISTLNLVDLAGSESVRHTGATGERQKEGGLINQSLLTLSRVIVALGTPNQLHINFRDSKLTRILQPSLSGNARMAVICCATPSELYLEETRSTLQFAQRAKLVKTNAQINEVLDERSMIRRLQRELAEAKRHNSIPGNNQVRELEAQVANVGSQAMEAKAKLNRLKASILNAGYFFDQSMGNNKGRTLTSSSSLTKRRKSDGVVQLNQRTPTKVSILDQHAPKTIPRETKARTLEPLFLPVDQELALVQQALATRNQVIHDLNATVSGYAEELQKKNDEVDNAMEHNSTLSQEQAVACARVDDLLKVVASLESSLETLVKEREQLVQDKEAQLSNSAEMLQKSMEENMELKSKLDETQKKFDEIQIERVRGAFEFAALTSERTQLLEDRDADRARLQEMAGKTEFLTSNLNEATKERDAALTEIVELETQLETKSEEALLMEQTLSTVNTSNAKQLIKTAELEGRLVDSESANESLVSELKSIQSAKGELLAQLADLEKELKSLHAHCTSLESASENERELQKAFVSDAESRITTLEKEKEEANANLCGMAHSNQELQYRLNELEAALPELRLEKEEISRQYQDEIQRLQSLLQDTNEKLHTQREEQNALVSSLKERLQLSEGSRGDLQSTLEALQGKMVEMESRIAGTEEKLLLKDDEIQALGEARDLATAEKNSVETVLRSCQMSLENLENQLTAAGEQMNRLAGEKRDAIAEKEEMLRSKEALLRLSVDESEAKQNEVISLRSKVGKLEGAIQEYDTLQLQSIESEKALRSEIQDLKTAIEVVSEAKDGVEQQLLAAVDEVSDLKAKFENAEAELAKAIENVSTLQDQIAEKESVIQHFKEDKDERTNQLELRLEDVIRSYSERGVEVERVRSDLSDLEAKVKQKDEESQSLRETILLHLDHIRDLQSELRSCEISIAAKDAAYAEMEVSTELEMRDQKRLHDESLLLVSRKQKELEGLHSALSECSEQLAFKIADINSLEVTLVSQKAITADLEKAVSLWESKSMEDQETIKLLLIEKEQARMTFESRFEEAIRSAGVKEEELENSRLTIMELKDRLQSLESDLVSANSTSSEQQVTIHGHIKEKEEIRLQLRKLEEESSSELKKKQEEFETLHNMAELQKVEFIALVQQRDSLFDQINKHEDERLEIEKSYTAKNRDMVERYEEEMIELQEQIESVFHEATSLERQKTELECLVDELRSDLTSQKKMCCQLEDELEKSSQARDDIAQSLRDRESERDEATAEVERLYQRSRELTKSLAETVPKEKEINLQQELSELKSENTELKLLLASVNDSEERLRRAVAVADSNCKAKAAELEDAVHRLSQLEEELSQSRRAHSDRDTHSHSLTQIENLLSEKNKLERLLFEEKESKRNFEDNLKKQMGEEQRVLLQEGESMMSILRAKIDDYEVRIQRSESEAYTARQQVEEVNDEKRNLEEKFLEAQEQVEGFSAAMKHQETQITLLQSELNKTKSESYSLKESVIDMKDRMRRSARDSEKAARESEMASSEVSTLKRKLSSMETQVRSIQAENQKLKNKVQVGEENVEFIAQLKAEIQEKDRKIEQISQKISELEQDRKKILEDVAIMQSGAPGFGREKMVNAKERQKLGEEIANLKGEINMKDEQMKVKDKRIQKLEATRLTKGQLETIKKNKLDNVRLQKECEKLTSELARLQSDLPSVESETKLKSEISELRFDKEALESKLRKFATHCQRLEDDKAGMADALKSCNVDIEAYGSDISEAIIHLCDRLTSVEEAHRKSKISRSLDMQNSLAAENNQLRQRLEEVSSSENRMAEKLRTATREAEESKKALELHNPETSFTSTDTGNKLRYLEQENLQLMVDIRATKKQLQAAREELESIRMNAPDNNPTSEFGNIGFQTYSGRSRGTALLGEGVAETSDTIELTNLAKGYVVPITSASKKSPESQKRKILADNTNRAACTDTTTARIEKRPRLVDAPGASALKVGNRRAKTTATPGLGESTSLESDSTGECKQS